MQQLNLCSDKRLVDAYARGDNKAFDILLQRHKDAVFSYIIRIVKNEDIANDIFQETFVKAIMQIRQQKYSDTGKFAAWINRIAHNLIIDNFRQGKIEISTSIEDDISIINHPTLSEATIEQKIAGDEIRTDINSIIESLPSSQREVVRLRFFNDMSFKEIADATGVSINTSLGRMRYALANMRKIAKERKIEFSF